MPIEELVARASTNDLPAKLTEDELVLYRQSGWHNEPLSRRSSSLNTDD
ncbi:hypothetical protein [Serratia fonticola]